MLYKKNSTPSLNDELFKNPTSEYRGTPFWAWNNMLTAEELQRQIDVFKEMGLGGFHMHVRTGLKNKYLSDEYMELVKTCVEKAKKEDMLAWLYDEDRWPSGAAGGLVTCDEKYRARSLLFTTKLNAAAYRIGDKSRSEASRSENGTLLACYDVVLDKDGSLKSYKRIDKDDEAEGTKWYALLEIYSNNSWHNDQTYVDTLNKEAIERFIEVMDTPADIVEEENAVELKDVEGNITFDNVSFHYSDDTETEVLSGINLEIKKGENVAIVGPSGGGKTTLCNLIPRFYDVTDGRILIDGQDIKNVTLKS